MTNPLFVARTGDGPPVLFLHGLGGSHASWLPVADRLQGLRCIIPDLLGFGRSPKPPGRYDLDEHMAALEPVIAAEQPLAVVGHSMGGVVALEVLRRNAGIAAGVLVSPAVFPATRSRGATGGGLALQGLLVEAHRNSRALCETLSLLRPVLRKLLPLFARGLPNQVVRDGLEHTWASYSGSLERVIRSGAGPALLRDASVARRVTILQARDDRTVPVAVVQPFEQAVAHFELIDGGHEAPVTRPGPVATAIERALAVVVPR